MENEIAANSLYAMLTMFLSHPTTLYTNAIAMLQGDYPLRGNIFTMM